MTDPTAAPPITTAASDGPSDRTGPRPTVWALLTLGVVVAMAAAGFVVGTSTGEDLNAARAGGAAVGQRLGGEAGARDGYDDGFAQGKADVYERSYEKAYRSAYRKAFRRAGVKPPRRVAVRGD